MSDNYKIYFRFIFLDLVIVIVIILGLLLFRGERREAWLCIGGASLCAVEIIGAICQKVYDKCLNKRHKDREKQTNSDIP